MEAIRIPETLRKNRKGSFTPPSMTSIDRDRMIAELSNKTPGNLTGLDCPACLNRGYFHRVDGEGHRYVEECACMNKRRSLERIKRSGLSDLLKRYTMDAWQTDDLWQDRVKRLAMQYVERQDGWFVMTGSVGAGKTHLCTAICGLLLERGMDVRYTLWRDFSVQAKALVNDEAGYKRLVEPLKQCKVLYLDDLFKTGKGQQPTTGDVNLAFETLNRRYNDSNLLTIISSEYSLNRLNDIDEATASRIYERAGDYYISLKNRQNWRTERK